MNDTLSELDSLSWYRLRLTLRNIADPGKEHALAITHAIIKSISTCVDGEKASDSIFFHFAGKRMPATFVIGSTFSLDVIFVRKPIDYVNAWRQTCVDYLNSPYFGRNFKLDSISETQNRSLTNLKAEYQDVPLNGELCLEFITRLGFTPLKDRDRTFLTKEMFLDALAARLKKLFGVQINVPDQPNLSVLPWYWSCPNPIVHESKSQPGQKVYLKGCIGNLYLKGDFGSLLPLLLICGELHAGTDITYGQGFYRLHTEPTPFFSAGRFPKRAELVRAVRNVVERHDAAADLLCECAPNPFHEDRVADALLRELQTGTYHFTPLTAFETPKKDGTSRMLEMLSTRDLVVLQCIRQTLTDYFDRMFEPGSIGYRKSISREAAVVIVQSALAEGFTHVVESDIEDFFPSVDISRLSVLLEQALPSADQLLLDLLRSFINTGYLLKGQLYQRQRGLPQGSPLSPLLANLYLDSFDEALERLDVKLIRYADDFIILTKGAETANDVLETAKKSLKDIGIELNPAKTTVRRITDGFRFLGMTFRGPNAEIISEESSRAMREPLYLTKPYLFMSLNGDAFDIKKDNALTQSVPIRRISEIMVMDRAVFSSAVIKRCAEEKIPFTITLDSGYYITTIKPDTKNFFDIAHRQANCHENMSDTELLLNAKGFAEAKFNNYIALFRQRYAKVQSPLVQTLTFVMNNINAAGSVEEVRGIEGGAAKKIYAALNEIVLFPDFHMTKRDRKHPDRMNSLLNFGHYMMFSRINATVRAAGLNPYLGYLHSSENDYESLVCDIQEIFRPNVDRFIINLINLKIIESTDFNERPKGLFLTELARQDFLNRFEGVLDQPADRGMPPLKECIYGQVQAIKKHFLEDKPFIFYKWGS